MASRWERIKFGLMLRAVGVVRQITLGARCAVIVEGKVLLVRHGYVAGWQLPGGGVEPGETAEQAAHREVLEETGIEIEGAARLFGLYHATHFTNRDHVALYIASAVRQKRAFAANREIAEMGWFDIGALPQEVSPATRRRLAEIGGEMDISPHW